MDFLSALKEYGAAWFQLIKDHFNLFLLEAQLTKLSIFPLIMCSAISLILSSILWMIILILIGYMTYRLSLNLLLSLLVVLGVNVLVLVVALIFTNRFYHNVGFEKTRKQWRLYKQLQLDFEHDNLKAQN